jgi:2-keto-3-deoxy-L-rhamnonate aldolase RhmA
MVVLQIETKRAFEACDELLSVQNIDAVMVGPVDLSISLGIPGQFDNPLLIDIIEKVADSCRRHGVAPGIQNRDLKMARFWRDHGMLFLGCSNETTMLYDRAREITSALR